jgi:thiamine kinase-like enzyme
MIHGDLILDNVIETKDSFVLIDWRQDFAGRVDIGDVHYDLAKLNHNLIFNHELVNSKHYTLKHQEEGIVCDILCRKNLIDCKEVLYSFIKGQGYDLDKVRLLTSLIWINMSPLHSHPLDRFLFNFGKYNLFRCLERAKKI